MIQPKWSAERKRLWRQARHQVLVHMTAKPYSPFDAEGNVVGDEHPGDFKRYWDSLSDTERAFEILQNTNAAVFIQFWNKIQDSIPKPPIAPRGGKYDFLVLDEVADMDKDVWYSILRPSNKYGDDPI